LSGHEIYEALRRDAVRHHGGRGCRDVPGATAGAGHTERAGHTEPDADRAESSASNHATDRTFGPGSGAATGRTQRSFHAELAEHAVESDRAGPRQRLGLGLGQRQRQRLRDTLIYAGGMAVDANGNNHWLLRRSTTGATGTYTNVFNVIDQDARAMTNIVFDYHHGVWVGIADHVYYSPTGNAGTWTPILDYSGTLFITGLCATTSGILAVGSINTPPPTWVTMASADHATWSTLDQFTSADAWAQSCVQNGSDIYVSGMTDFSTGEWVTRHALESTPTSWTTSDTVPDNGSSPIWGPIKAMGKRGTETYEVGQLCERGICHWHTRRTPGAGGVWIDSDDFMDTTSSTSEATGFAYSLAYGSAFVVGAGGTGEDVRRL
jgi:hypothetical protein